jgi:hypothetical protein
MLLSPTKSRSSLGIGIGANSAIFRVVDALLLRPLPYPHPERLAAVWLHSPGIGILRDWPSPGQYADIQSQNHSFEEIDLAQSRTFTLMGRAQPEEVDVLSTQSSLLSMFGVKPHCPRGDCRGRVPAHGTLCSEQDFKPNRAGIYSVHGSGKKWGKKGRASNRFFRQIDALRSKQLV